MHSLLTKDSWRSHEEDIMTNEEQKPVDRSASQATAKRRALIKPENSRPHDGQRKGITTPFGQRNRHLIDARIAARKGDQKAAASECAKAEAIAPLTIKERKSVEQAGW
jgi:hypothetical protein